MHDNWFLANAGKWPIDMLARWVLFTVLSCDRSTKDLFGEERERYLQEPNALILIGQESW